MLNTARFHHLCPSIIRVLKYLYYHYHCFLFFFLILLLLLYFIFVWIKRGLCGYLIVNVKTPVRTIAIDYYGAIIKQQRFRTICMERFLVAYNLVIHSATFLTRNPGNKR